MARAWITVFETAAYLARSGRLLSSAEQEAVVQMLARDPTCGEIMEGTGGVRKVRFAVDGRGKRGGVRVVYYFHSEALPITC